MKIAVISDLHANYLALQAIAADLEHWQPDHVVIAGDIVNRGSRPAECVQFILERVAHQGWLLVRGNHEEYVISRREPQSQQPGVAFEVNRPSFWTYQRLNGEVSCLEAMPYQQTLIDPNGGEVRFLHGSILGLRDGIYPETSDRSLVSKLGTPRAASRLSLVCVGHTHRPLVRSLNGTLVVNAGSAGLPFDGHLRPSYARLTWLQGGWKAEVVRVAYDHNAALKDFEASGFLAEGGPLVRLIYYELEHACSLLYNWAYYFQEPVLRGQISLEESVQVFMSQLP